MAAPFPHSFEKQEVGSRESFQQEGEVGRHRVEEEVGQHQVEVVEALLLKAVAVTDCRREEEEVEVLLSCSYAVPSTAPQTGGAGIRLEHSHRLAPVSHHWQRL